MAVTMDSESEMRAADPALQVILAVDAAMHGEPEDLVLAALLEQFRARGFDPDPLRLRTFAEAISDAGLER
jgi:hypothetical protein